MNFKVNISNVAAFNDAIDELCEKNRIDEPNHIEINSDDSPLIKIFISDTFIARLSREDVKKLKTFG
ncbi:hypothetical protein [Mucilaginibacter endophyticus]|uniref:hypothetical protein n=1 Tax=Mucilaginibacter endophyticus TaxID=2675003 RepID=UPI000E0CE038|nr:hypothetical protein [Mucilaginibacter endophyticus]